MLSTTSFHAYFQTQIQTHITHIHTQILTWEYGIKSIK